MEKQREEIEDRNRIFDQRMRREEGAKRYQNENAKAQREKGRTAARDSLLTCDFSLDDHITI